MVLFGEAQTSSHQAALTIAEAGHICCARDTPHQQRGADHQPRAGRVPAVPAAWSARAAHSFVLEGVMSRALVASWVLQAACWRWRSWC